MNNTNRNDVMLKAEQTQIMSAGNANKTERARYDGSSRNMQITKRREREGGRRERGGGERREREREKMKRRHSTLSL